MFYRFTMRDLMVATLFIGLAIASFQAMQGFSNIRAFWFVAGIFCVGAAAASLTGRHPARGGFFFVAVLLVILFVLAVLA